jgi:hypothetical protein
MANILGLALKVTGDASGLAKSLTPVDRALDNLAKQADRATAVFKPLTEASAGAAAAQEQFAAKFATLAEQLRTGVVAPQEYAAAFGQLKEEAQQAAEAFERGIEVTERYTKAEERQAAQLQEIATLLEQKAITEETAARARAELSGDNARAAEAAAETERQLVELRQEAIRITESVTTEQEKRQASLERLKEVLDAGFITEEIYQRAVEKTSGITAAAAEAEQRRQAIFEEGARIQRQYGDQTKYVADEIARYVELEKAGAIDTQALNAAAIDKLGLDKQAAESAKARADAVSAAEKQQADAFAEARRVEAAAAAQANRERAALETEANKIRQANFTAQERFDEAIAAAARLKQQGVLTEQDFNRELERQAGLFARATVEAGRTAERIEAAGDAGVLKFRELSGVLAVLPGPIGNVAGRLSGLASAGEGLTRAFSSGLTPGLQSVGRSITSIINPVNLGLAAVAGFGAAAVGVVRGLADLEGRLEQLGNTALRLGTDFQTIQVLAEAAQRTGQSVETVASGLQRFNVTLAEARSGSGQAAAAFAELGISQERLRTADTAGLAKEVSDALQGIEDPAKRAALAVDVLGKNGLTLLPVFNALEESRISLERFAAGISEIDRDRVSSLGTAFDNVQTALAGLGQAAILPFAGAVEGFANLLADLIAAVTRLAQAIGTVLTPVLDAVGETFTALGDGVFSVTQLFDGWLGNTDNAKASVDRLRESAEEPLSGGFAKEFEKTLQNVTGSVSDAINESAKFGRAGFDAALKYQTAVDDLKTKLDAGLFNEETFRREAEKAGAAFKTELAAIEEDAKLDIQINAETEKTLAGLQEKINKAVEGAQQFGQSGFDAAAQFQDKLRDLGAQFEDGRINAATLAQEVAKATSEYDKQIEGFKKIDELQKRTLENEKNRVAELLKAGDTATQLERDIEVVDRERLRLEEEIRKQREAGNIIAADAATAKLAQLDQLQAKLDTQQQAVDQGFADGFTKTFEATNKSIDALIGKAEQFGNVGALAAEALEQGIAKAQQQAQDGILTAETYQREVDRQQDLFNQRLAAAQRVEDFLTSKIDDRQKAELEAVKQLEERKKQAAVNVQALEAKILTEQKSIEEARKSGNLADARAGATRLKQLQQAKRGEEQIANGRQQANRQQAQQLQQGNTAAQQFQSLVARQNDAFLQGFQNAYAGANAALAQSARVAEEQARRMEALTRPTNATVNVADIRTAEGQALVQDVAAQAQDPALIEARLQTRLLNAIASGITGAASNYFNQPVAIVGAARMG